MTRGLKRAILLSILFHLFVLFSARQLPWLPEPSGRTAGSSVDVLLRPVKREQPVGLPAEPAVQADQNSRTDVRELLKSPAAERASPILQGFSPSTVTDHTAVVDRALPPQAQPVTPSSAPATQSEPVSLDGVRQYRLNLAREARKSKIYPTLARERGWEGVVVVVVTTVAGLWLPQVTLSQSSGNETLDRAATDLVELAVQSAPMPESLRGQQFALTLPIHYQLAE